MVTNQSELKNLAALLEFSLSSDLPENVNRRLFSPFPQPPPFTKPVPRPPTSTGASASERLRLFSPF